MIPPYFEYYTNYLDSLSHRNVYAMLLGFVEFQADFYPGGKDESPLISV